MNHLLPQHDLQVVMSNLSPLIPFVSGESCEKGTKALLGLLGEALEAQEAASKRADELKLLKPKGLMEYFSPEKAVVNGSASPAKNKQQEQQPHVRAPESPKKTQSPKKRARKASSKKVVEGSEFSDEEDEDAKKPKKQGKNGAMTKKKKNVKNDGGGWNGEEYPKITKVTKCEEGEDGLRVEVHAKKQGRGHWLDVIFSLDSMQLSSIDKLPHHIKDIVRTSFQKALTGAYGQKWPNALRLVLAGATWAKDILPEIAPAAPDTPAATAAAGGENGDDFAGLDDPNANMDDIE